MSLKSAPAEPRSTFGSVPVRSPCRGAAAVLSRWKGLAGSPRVRLQPRARSEGLAARAGSGPGLPRQQEQQQERGGAAGARTCGGEGRPRLRALPARTVLGRGERRGAGDTGIETGCLLLLPGAGDPCIETGCLLLLLPGARDTGIETGLPPPPPACPALRLVSGGSRVQLGRFGPGRAFGWRFNSAGLFTLPCYSVMQVGSWGCESFRLGRNAGELGTANPPAPSRDAALWADVL